MDRLMTAAPVLMLGDCLERMSEIPAGSVDMVLCDLPYGLTACGWDTVIPFAPLWDHYKRVAKRNGAIVLTAAQPFASALIMSNLAMFRYDWVWQKTVAPNFMQLKRRPAKKHELVLVFYRGQPTYNPQMVPGRPYADAPRRQGSVVALRNPHDKLPIKNSGVRYPGSVQCFSNGNSGNMHPTQKPVDLLEYMIRTYTNEGETVLDNCMGSGTCAIACLNTGRRFIGIERDAHYFAVGSDRIRQHMAAVAAPELEAAD
jgi:hypothetical protein